MFLLAIFSILPPAPADAHERTLSRFIRAREAAQTRTSGRSEAPGEATGKTCRLKLELAAAETGLPLSGLVRVSNRSSRRSIALQEGIEREELWYAVPAAVSLTVPQTGVRIEAFHGLHTEQVRREIDLTGKAEVSLRLDLPRFYNPSGLRSGNTHLHLRSLTRKQAEEYLQTVSEADDLDLLFVSYLRRVPGEETYITNSFSAEDLTRLSTESVLFGNGEEHRHNFGAGGEGYGHVMFLNIRRLIQPVSIGPGIMQQGTDGIPLQKGIREARADGAAVIWCHNRFGLEDIPNWVTGLLDAQNIFDGGSHGSYEDSFYRYLNVGMKVPFSTGTDWFVYDLSRVYVPVQGKLTPQAWLKSLAAGKSYITNGTFLEFEVDGKSAGETIRLNRPGSLRVRALGIGRNHFDRMELVMNGKAVHSVVSRPENGHFAARIDYSLAVERPAWLALRIHPHGSSNEFGKELFAHTSPIYVEFQGRSVFEPETARGLIDEMQRSISAIQEQARFADSPERDSVLSVYTEAIEILRQKLTTPLTVPASDPN